MCIVPHTYPPTVQSALLAHIVHVLSAPPLRMHQVRQKCIVVLGNVLLTEIFITVMPQWHISVPEKLRVAEIFRHSNLPCAMLTNAQAGSETRTDGDRGGFFPV